MEFKYDKHNKYHRFARSACITVISLIVFVWVWWIIARVTVNPAIPDPFLTFDALFDLIENGDSITGLSLGTYVKASLTKFIYGFLLALVVALPLGLLLGNFKILREFLTPWIEVLRPIAPIAWAPVFILLYGYKEGAMLVVFIGIFFPLLTNIIFGVTKIDPVLVDASKTLGASNLQIFLKVLIPSTVPYLMNGVKVGLGIGWMCIVAAELYATPLGGIGFYVANMITYGAFPEAFAGIIVIAVLGLLTTSLAEYVSKIVSKRMGIDA
ncbi:MAG: ABC transporter permease [Thermoplasmata archaeon]|jgi:NitT/TauT family transport system permease protein|nr:ABC transporter permease [Thermoplasmata archaeon]